MAIQTEEALRKRFKAMDLDGSDEISMAEFIKFALKDAYPRSEHAWSSCSRSGTRTGTARSRLRSSFASSASTPSSPRSSRSSTARAKPEAAGDPVSIACGDADGPAVEEVGEAVVLRARASCHSAHPPSPPSAAPQRCPSRRLGAAHSARCPSRRLGAAHSARRLPRAAGAASAWCPRRRRALYRAAGQVA